MTNAKPNDIVDLCFITPNAHIWALGMKRKEASDVMRSWYAAREEIRKNGEKASELKDWLENGTFASNHGYSDPVPEGEDTNFARSVVIWSSVVGMYMKYTDPEADKLEALQRRYQRQELQRLLRENERLTGNDESEEDE